MVNRLHRKWKTLSAIFALIVGALGALSETEAMRFPVEVPEGSPMDPMFPRPVFAIDGQLVPREISSNPSYWPFPLPIHISCITASMGSLYAGFFPNRLLTSVAFEADSWLRTIGANAFAHCAALQSICIPAGVEVLAHDCFASCQSLASVTFEWDSGLQRMESHAFHDCSALPSICLPGTVQTLGTHCFESCRSLQFLTFDTDPHLHAIGMYAFRHSAIRSVSIPETVRTLEAHCCDSCYALTSVTFEADSQLQDIQERAFFSCFNLRSFTLPATVRELREECFCFCVSLVLALEENSQLQTIEKGVFFGCFHLQPIALPETLQELGKECFCWCNASFPRACEIAPRIQETGARVYCLSRVTDITLPDGTPAHYTEGYQDWLRSRGA